MAVRLGHNVPLLAAIAVRLVQAVMQNMRRSVERACPDLSRGFDPPKHTTALNCLPVMPSFSPTFI
jgi:hypothetical protein